MLLSKNHEERMSLRMAYRTPLYKVGGQVQFAQMRRLAENAAGHDGRFAHRQDEHAECHIC